MLWDSAQGTVYDPLHQKQLVLGLKSSSIGNSNQAICEVLFVRVIQLRELFANSMIKRLCVPLDYPVLLFSKHLCSHWRWYLSLCQAPSSLSIPTLQHLAFPPLFCLSFCPMSSVSCSHLQFHSCLLKSVSIPACHQIRPSVTRLFPSIGASCWLK